MSCSRSAMTLVSPVTNGRRCHLGFSSGHRPTPDSRTPHKGSAWANSREQWSAIGAICAVLSLAATENGFAAEICHPVPSSHIDLRWDYFNSLPGARNIFGNENFECIQQ